MDYPVILFGLCCHDLNQGVWKRWIRWIAVRALIGLIIAVGVLFVFESKPAPRYWTNVNISFVGEKRVSQVRDQILSVSTLGGKPKYPDARIQTVMDPKSDEIEYSVGGYSKMFHIRVTNTNTELLESDLRKLFSGDISSLVIR